MRLCEGSRSASAGPQARETPSSSVSLMLSATKAAAAAGSPASVPHSEIQ